MKLFHYESDIYYFSSSKSNILNIGNAIKVFLSSRNVNFFFKEKTSFSLLFTNLNIEGWSFFLSHSGCYKGIVSLDNLNSHKRKLKLILKNSFSESFSSTLILINNTIYNWCLMYACSDYSWDIFAELDIYLYRLLWKWARKRHPRRPNTWIYSKYWKYFPSRNCWNFYFLDLYLGKCVFLYLHKNYNYKTYSIPSSLNVFSFQNYNKLGIIWLKKCSQVLHDLHLSLFKLQSGKCLNCGGFFLNMSLGSIKIVRVNKSFGLIVKYILIHNHC